MISLGIILTGIGWTAVQCSDLTIIMILPRITRAGIILLTVLAQRGGRNSVSAIESPHESLRQVQIRGSVEAMACQCSTIVISNREFEIEGYTVKTSLLDTGTDAVLRQHNEGICSTTVRRSQAKINTAGGNYLSASLSGRFTTYLMDLNHNLHTNLIWKILWWCLTWLGI